MSTSAFYQALLQPAVIQILRAAGFNSAKPSAVETLTDLAARFLHLMATSAVLNAQRIHRDSVPTVQDIRLALTANAFLYPQMTADEEARKPDVEIAGEMVPFEDLRGVMSLIDWAHGDVNKEIRRIAGLSGDELNIDQIAAGMDEKMDYLTTLKKGKGDDDLRFQGTILGKETEPQPTVIIGGDATLKEFMDRYRTKIPANLDEDDGSSPGESSMLSSAPATPGESADAVDTPAPSADTTETAAATPSALPA